VFTAEFTIKRFVSGELSMTSATQ